MSVKLVDVLLPDERSDSVGGVRPDARSDDRRGNGGRERAVHPARQFRGVGIPPTRIDADADYGPSQTEGE